MNFGNTRKDRFIAAIPVCSLDSETDKLTTKCKFNFAYFEKQVAGQDFNEWPEGKLHKLLNKLKDYSAESLKHWSLQPVGASGTVLIIYGAFPKSKSDFTCPAHVPHQAQWGRFRLDQATRLVGFVVPHDYHGKAHPVTNERFDCNTFYVVFLDAGHRFYKTEKK